MAEVEFLGQSLDVGLIQETARASKRKLTPAKIETLSGPKFYGDGGNLWLQVAPGGGRSWVFRYTISGKAAVMGLGSAQEVSLTEARGRAIICRRVLRDGVDPAEERKRTETAAGDKRRADDKRRVTLQAAYEEYVATHRQDDQERRVSHKWGYCLSKQLLPSHGYLAVSAVSDETVAEMLQPIWKAKPETAKKARRELAQLLDFAKAKKWRAGDNPARAVAELRLQLGTSVGAGGNHDAMAYAKLPKFWAALASREETAALALMFTILTCARTSETVGSLWSEIDLQERVWTIPAERMKGGKVHRVALSRAATDVLAKLNPRVSEFVFPGLKGGEPLSRAAMDAVLKRMGRKDGVTVHGFRSTFSDWAFEERGDRDTASAALAHVVGDKVERAYRRSDALEKRRALMDAWADYCLGGSQ